MTDQTSMQAQREIALKLGQAAVIMANRAYDAPGCEFLWRTLYASAHEAFLLAGDMEAAQAVYDRAFEKAMKTPRLVE